MQGGHSGRAIGFVEGRLELDGGDQRGHHVDDLVAETTEGLGEAVTILREPFEKARRQFLGPRVDPDNDRIADSADGREQTVHEMHGSFPHNHLD